MNIFFTHSLERKEEPIEEECCKKSFEENGLKCCKSKEKTDETLNSNMSQVELGSIPNNNAGEMTRHQARFGITSFVYRTRRPFHPGRLYNQFMKRYFMMDSFEGQGNEGWKSNSHDFFSYRQL